MPCANQTITIPIGVYFNKNYTASFIAQNSGSYGVKVTYTNSYPPTFLGLMTLTVTVNGQTVKSGITVSQLTLLDIGQVNKGSQINIIITVNGAVTNIALPIYVTLGWVSDSEVCYYFSDLNIPVLNNIKGAICINLDQNRINLYQSCAEITGIPCLDCVVSKTIPISGQFEPGVNYVYINVSGPVSQQTINTLTQYLKPGTQIAPGVTVLSVYPSGNSIVIKTNVTSTQMEAQAPPEAYIIVAIGIAIGIVILALSIGSVFITQSKTTSYGVSVGVALLLGGIGIGAGVFLYDYLKKHT